MGTFRTGVCRAGCRPRLHGRIRRGNCVIRYEWIASSYCHDGGQPTRAKCRVLPCFAAHDGPETRWTMGDFAIPLRRSCCPCGSAPKRESAFFAGSGSSATPLLLPSSAAWLTESLQVWCGIRTRRRRTTSSIRLPSLLRMVGHSTFSAAATHSW